MDINPEAVKYVAAYVGGTLAGVFGAALAINKIREMQDPSYTSRSYYPAGSYLPQEVLDALK